MEYKYEKQVKRVVYFYASSTTFEKCEASGKDTMVVRIFISKEVREKK